MVSSLQGGIQVAREAIAEDAVKKALARNGLGPYLAESRVQQDIIDTMKNLELTREGAIHYLRSSVAVEVNGGR
jgi:hypothetical protein